MTEDKFMCEKKAEGQFIMLPVIPLRGMTVLPGINIHFDLNREKSLQALEYAMTGGGKLFLAAQKDAGVEDPAGEQIYPVGTICVVKPDSQGSRGGNQPGKAYGDSRRKFKIP